MQEYMKKTLEYYENNAKNYKNEWTDDFLKNYNFTVPSIFLEFLPKRASILDLGCGTGRDSKYFLDHGYKVTAVDGSFEFCNMASKLLNIKVRELNFLDMDYHNEFDGVFACASLLHLKDNDLLQVLKLIHTSLKDNGILYCSFKKGTGTRVDEKKRFYNDMEEEKFKLLLNKLNVIFDLLKVWETNQYGSHQKFINFILRKE